MKNRHFPSSLLLALTLVVPLAAQDPLAPPRGFLGPGPGDATRNGPGDPGDLPVTDSGSWTRWWAFNREAFILSGLGMDPAILAPASLDRGAPPLPRSPWRPADDLLYTEIVPQVISLLERTRDLDIQRASLLALGKIGGPPKGIVMPPDVPAPISVLQEHLKASNQGVQNAAVLGLGAHGGIVAIPLLAAIALDEKPGRAALGRSGKIDRRTRAFAAHGLGIAGRRTTTVGERRFVVRRLLALLKESSKDTDLAVSAVIGLGHCPVPFQRRDGPESTHRDAVFRSLVDFLRSPRADQLAKAQAPVALARQCLGSAGGDLEARMVLRRQVIVELLPLISGRSRTPALLREGAVEALGLITGEEAGPARLSGPDADAIIALRRVAEDGQEREAGLAAIALARVAARGPVPADSVTSDLRTSLGTWLSEGTPSLRPWASIALGILLHHRQHLGDAPPLGTLTLLERRLKSTQSPEERAAVGLALGLAGHKPAIPILMDQLDKGDFRIRGLFSLSLALLPAPQAVPELRAIVSRSIYRPYLVRDVTLALGVLGFKGLGQVLVSNLYGSRFMPEKIAALQALAWSRDPTAMTPLLAVLHRKRIEGRRIDDTSRAFAIAAIGAIAASEAAPFNAAWAAGVIWAGAPGSLHDAGGGGGVLDLF